MFTTKMFFLNIQNTRYMQYLSAISATLSIACCSMYIAWASPVLPKLSSSHSPIGIPITKEEGSWIASIFLLGSVPTGFITPYLINHFGRKRLLLISAVLLFVPWMIITFAQSVWLICLARCLAGISLNFATVGSVIYNGEIAEKDIRGKISAILLITSLSGKCFVLTVGPFVSYTTLNISCSMAPVIFGIIFSLMPESPYYLIKVGKVEEARANLLRLTSKSSDKMIIEKQLQEIQTTVENETVNQGTVWELMTRPEHRKALIVLTGVKTLQQLSGTLAIQEYMQTIVEASDSSISPEISSIIFGAIQVLAAVLSAALVERTGRKRLLIISALGCALGLIAEGTYFYLQDFAQTDTSFISWIPTTGLLVSVVMASLGIAGLPYVLLGELFQTNVKGTAVSLMTCYGTTLGFLVTKYFAPISVIWGMYTAFWIFAGTCVLGAVFVVFMLPETKGKSFDEIQKKMNKRR